MAITKVQGPLGGTGTSPLTNSFTNTPAEGNLLIAWISYTAGSNPSVAGFTQASFAVEGSAGYIGIWYKVAGAGESKDVVLTVTGASGIYFFIEEWTGITSPVLDQIGKTDDTGGTVTSRSSGTTPETTANDELAMAGIAYGNTTSAQSWSNSFTDERSVNTETIALASKVLSTIGAQETTLSWTTARRAGGCIATFKAGSTVLIIGNAAQAQAVDNVVLTQHNILTNANIVQAQIVENVVLIQHNILEIQDVVQSQTVEGITLTQHNLLDIQDVAQIQAVGNPTLIYHSASGVSLTIQDVTQIQAVGNLNLTQHYILDIQNVIQKQVVNNVLLGYLPVVSPMPHRGGTIVFISNKRKDDDEVLLIMAGMD